MAAVIRDPILEEQILADRAKSGADRYDEVWEGVYIMAPMPNDEHQMLVGRFTRVLDEVITDHDLGQVRPGVNISDRLEDWQQNYRVPDVAVFLNDTKAVNHDSFWHGGPDFAIEIVSPGDQTRDKLTFYAATQTRELLIIDRAPWQLELYRLEDATMELATIATTSSNTTVLSESTSLEIRLLEGDDRPRIQILHARLGKSWTV